MATRIGKAALLGCALLLTMPASAQIYKTTDENGNVVFSDAPPAGSTSSEQVELSQTNTTPPPPVVNPIKRPRPEPEDVSPAPVEVSITSPANETTIPMGGGNFSVSAAVSSGARNGQTLQLLMDGAPQGPPQESGNWSLQSVMRGPHDLVVEVLDRQGKVLGSSESVRVYVLRPSVN